MKRIALTSEWLANWTVTKTTEVTDRGCPGLIVRAGPQGIKTFYRWSDVRDDATGKPKRRRIRLGHWPAYSLADAQKAVLAARESRSTQAPGPTASTVAQIAEAYRRDVLAHREPTSLAWSWGIIKTHVINARPDPKRPPFGEWTARDVRAPDIAALVRTARTERTLEVIDTDGEKVTRKIGGPAVARATLREVKAMFAAAVGSGALEMTPAGVLQATALGLRGTKRARYLNADELKALFAALDLNALLDGTAKSQKLTETARLGIALLHYAPVRSHSLVAAEWKEIDLDAARWTIPPAKLKLHRDARAEARPFTVPLPPTAVEILRKLKDLAGKSPWVLASPKDPKKHLSPKVLVRALTRLQEDGRLALGSRSTIHDTRRTWRAWAGELGVPFEVAEKSLAHVLPGVADVYARAEMIEQRAEAAEMVAAAFDRIRLGKAAGVVPLRERTAQ